MLWVSKSKRVICQWGNIYQQTKIFGIKSELLDNICIVFLSMIVNTYEWRLSLLWCRRSDDFFLSRERDRLSRDLWRRLRDRERLRDEELDEWRLRDLTANKAQHTYIQLRLVSLWTKLVLHITSTENSRQCFYSFKLHNKINSLTVSDYNDMITTETQIL